MKKIKISIITVSYNSSNTIEQTIKSVISQTYNNVEYIIIDGGSTDGTIDIIKRYESDISYWVSEKDYGIYDAMNKGVKKATGDIVAFLNSDDYYIDSTALERVVACWNKYDKIDILAGRIAMYNQFSILCGYSPEVTNLEQLCYRMILDHPAMFSRKKLFEEDGGFDSHYQIASDYAWVLKEYHMNRVIVPCQEVFTVFRLGGASSKITKKIALEVKDITQNINPSYYYQKYKNIIEDLYYNRQKQIERNNKIDEIILLNKNFAINILDKILETTKIAIWGYGAYGQECHEILERLGYKINLIIDNDKNKWQDTNCIQISGIDALEKFDGTVIISPSGHEKEIEEQMKYLTIRTVRYSEILKVLNIDVL